MFLCILNNISNIYPNTIIIQDFDLKISSHLIRIIKYWIMSDLRMRILLSNDDGVDSPALIPTIVALEKIGEVFTVVPVHNKSWTSKSNTRSLKPIEKKVVEIDGKSITTLDALPADCSNYGIYVGKKPDLLVTGANLGHNVGLSAYLSSGTVGAALEGLLAGVPSISISAPYITGQEMSPDNFTTTLEVLPKLVEIFYRNRPHDFAMLTTNLPLGVGNDRFVATTLERWIFGKLFNDEDGHVIPINYPDLNQESAESPLTDTWARKYRYSSILALNDTAQIIPRESVEQWLISNDLFDKRSRI